MTALRKQMAAETSGERRLQIRDQLMQLGREMQAEAARNAESQGDDD